MRVAFRIGPLLVLVALLAPPAVAADDRGAAPRTPPLTVRLYEPGELPSGARAAAQAVAAGILIRAQVPVEWVNCSPTSTGPAGPPECARPPEPRDLIVRLLRAPGTDPSKALGYSLIDIEQRRGWMATVYVDRVDRLAQAAGTDRGELLGRAIAHELTHLLLGTTRHSARGLMRARWNPADLVRDRPWDWRLSDGDSRLVRLAHAARIAQPGTPPTEIAELLAAPPGAAAPIPQ